MTAKPSLGSKAKGLFGSIRFWQIVAGTVIQVAAKAGAISQGIADIISAALGISVAVGTVDKYGAAKNK